jgi:arylsulfatase A-like enzyme
MARTDAEPVRRSREAEDRARLDIDVPARPRLLEVLGAGAATGAIAGLAAGMIDALWSWGPAAQFVPGFFARVRFVLFAGALHAAAGAAIGLALALALLALSRATRIGDLVRFGWRLHQERRARDPRGALAGLAIVLATLPCLAIALGAAYRLTVPYVAGRKVIGLVVVVSMGAALAAAAAAIVLGFVLGRRLEDLLRLAAARPRLGRALSSPYAPLAAAAGLVALGLAAWAIRSWETARALPLRGPLAAAVGLALAIPAAGPARGLVARLSALRPARRGAAWAGAAIALLALALGLGSTGAVKGASAYTGLGGPIARTLRKALDWDGDGHARALGGGDCDDGDRRVHPGAPEVPDDGIDQNCVGGDATARRSLDEVAFAAVPPGVPKDFNVLLVTIDTIRADHLSAYGYARKTTPNLDALAAAGALFEHGWAHAPSTRYSIPAILTGRLPLDVRYDTSLEGWPGLASDATTIAEALAPLGFTARGAITNYWYFDKSRRMDQGTTEYDNENARLHSGVPGAGPEQTRGSSSREQTDKALAFVERNAAQRWLLWVHYYDPHYAYEPHPEVPAFGADRAARYDGELAFTDLHVGRLLDALRARGLFERTVVVVTGDHGEGFGEHGVELHGYHLYAAQTKVPLIVRVPGVPPRRAATPAGHVDLLPTLVNLAGGAPTAEMQGRSLVDAIAGVDRDRVVYQQLSYEGNHEMRAGASQRCHVIYNVSPDTSWEVYRLDRDPAEARDLAADEGACADTRRAVERRFDAEQVPAGAAEALLPARPPIEGPLDADLGDAVRLLAVDAPATARPGEPLRLTWTFECRGEIARGWKVFAHVEGPNRTLLANGDHAPARPFEWWRPGQYVRYSTAVSIPRHARGRYTVWAGLFKGAARARARAPRARVERDAVAVASFEVSP